MTQRRRPRNGGKHARRPPGRRLPKGPCTVHACRNRLSRQGSTWEGRAEQGENQTRGGEGWGRLRPISGGEGASDQEAGGAVVETKVPLGAPWSHGVMKICVDFCRASWR
ncbi:unnamed protein product [Prorocentrum cordatum]|uniref:Uncharacterized protein n=1 Tax=Prorocentrum cordatum TaxID=2364126 RepID=A0ABN9XAG6_9DINO|nr:unnamed protein product [Polarella glacialis]